MGNSASVNVKEDDALISLDELMSLNGQSFPLPEKAHFGLGIARHFGQH
jgi:hypothetical protein